MPEHPIIQLVRRPIIAYLFGVLSAILILMLSQLIDGGLIIRLMGAMPKWRAVDLSSHDTFDPTCQYRYKVSNKEHPERDIVVLPIGGAYFFYPHTISQDKLINSYDFVTIEIDSKTKKDINVRYRVHDVNWMPTGEIANKKWETLLMDKQCP